MATLVTGGTSFVGANLVKDLAGAGHQVVCFDLDSPDQLLMNFLGSLSSQVSFVEGNILDRDLVGRVGVEHSIDKIVHAAVYTVNRVALEIQRSRDVIDINPDAADVLNLIGSVRNGESRPRSWLQSRGPSDHSTRRRRLTA